MAEEDPQVLEARRETLRKFRDRGPLSLPGRGEDGGIDPAYFDGRRRYLRELRDAAREERAQDKAPMPAAPVETQNGGGAEASRRPGVGPSADERRKRVAAMFLDALPGGSTAEDPTIQGTQFTEAGVRRFVAMLAERAGSQDIAGQPFFERLHTLCTQPAADGDPTFEGVNLTGVAIAAEFFERVKSEGPEAVRRLPGGEGPFAERRLNGRPAGMGRAGAMRAGGLLWAMAGAAPRTDELAGAANPEAADRIEELEQTIEEVKAKLQDR